ncbi:unnamed protein product, partial [Cyprideis torosa]
NNPAFCTAVSNDFSYDDIFSRELEALGNEGDVLVALSTSGNSKNVINAIDYAKINNIKVIGFSGESENLMNGKCDIAIKIPSKNTPRVQEAYKLILHIGQWTLFLDRDGVINKRLPDNYVRSIEEFEFLGGVKEALFWFSQYFDRIFIVTNQQGIDKGIMDHEDLYLIHDYLLSEVEKSGGKIDQIYYCPHLSIEKSYYRKPNPGMAIMAKEDFPEIEFASSIMVGDSYSDIVFGNKL